MVFVSGLLVLASCQAFASRVDAEEATECTAETCDSSVKGSSLLQSAAHAVKITQTQTPSDWSTVYENMRYTCDDGTFVADRTATTEESCKAACDASAQCTAVFFIHGQSTQAQASALGVYMPTPDRCLLYDSCSTCRQTSFFGTTYQKGSERCGPPPKSAAAHAPSPPAVAVAPAPAGCKQLADGGTWDNADLQVFYDCLADQCIEQDSLWDGVTCAEARTMLECDDSADLSGHPDDQQNTLFIGTVADACPVTCGKGKCR